MSWFVLVRCLVGLSLVVVVMFLCSSGLVMLCF